MTDIERLRRTLRGNTRRLNSSRTDLEQAVANLRPVLAIEPHEGPRPTPDTALRSVWPSQRHRTVINKSGVFKIFEGGRS